jgi:hypothetical protein
MPQSNTTEDFFKFQAAVETQGQVFYGALQRQYLQLGVSIKQPEDSSSPGQNSLIKLTVWDSKSISLISILIIPYPLCQMIPIIYPVL